MKLELHATSGEVMRAVKALQQLGLEQQVPEEMLFGLMLALEECGTNIVKHALQQKPGRTFSVVLHHTGSAVVIELRDSGPEFDPTQACPEDRDGQQHGGWGIPLVRRYTDEILYTRVGGENVLRLIKKLAF